MAENFDIPQYTSLEASLDMPTDPRLILSSEELGWEGLIARVYHEPPTFESTIVNTDTMYIPLVMFVGGAMYLEHRSKSSPWKGALIRSEGMSLKPEGWGGELRWEAVSSQPTQTLQLALSKDLLMRTAEEAMGYDPAHLTLIEDLNLQDSLLAQIGFTLWRELEQQDPIGKLYVQTTTQMLAVHLLRHHSSISTSTMIEREETSQGLTRLQVKRVIEFVQAHVDQDLSLETLAQQTGFSAYHFARLFRQTTGESPHQFVLRQRIENAQRLLKETDMPLAHIALASGFANQSHLTRSFKRYLDLTPRAYRRGD